MADVDMPDAGPSAPAKAKASGAKVAKGADAGTEGKKRFEVKKACFLILYKCCRVFNIDLL